MRQRFTLYRRGQTYYCQDTLTGKQQTLRTKEKGEALTLLHSKNEAFRQPMLNRQIGRTYFAAIDPAIGQRTWQAVKSQCNEAKLTFVYARLSKPVLGG